MVGACVSSIFLFEYVKAKHDEMSSGEYTGREAADVTLATIGALLLINACQIGRGLTWARITKLAPLPWRQKVMGLNAAVYMFSRGTGSIIGGFLSEENVYAIIVLCTCVAGSVIMQAALAKPAAP